MLVDRIKNEPLTTESLEKLIIEFRFEGTGDNGLTILKSIVKSELGGILDKTTPSPELISNALHKVRSVIKFIRALHLFNTEQFILSNPKFRGVLALTSDFNSLDIEDDVMSTLECWRYDDREMCICRDYALRLTRNFNILFALINEANELAIKLSDNQEWGRHE